LAKKSYWKSLIDSKDKNPWKKKEQNNTVGVTPKEVTDKISKEIEHKISEEIGSRIPKEVDEVPEETQISNDHDISINYVQNCTIWNRNEICVDEIFYICYSNWCGK
jgi:hypothetical protein